MNQTELINELEGLGIYVHSMHVKASFQEFNTISIEGYMDKEKNKMTKLMTQGDAVHAIKAAGMFIGSVDASGNFSVACNPTIQMNGTEARTELKRLAKINPGKLFFVAQLRGAEMVPVAPTLSI